MTERQPKQHMISSCLTPERRPTPMTSVSTKASSVMVGPRMAMPRAMLSTTSSCQQRHGDKYGDNVTFRVRRGFSRENSRTFKYIQRTKLQNSTTF